MAVPPPRRHLTFQPRQIRPAQQNDMVIDVVTRNQTAPIVCDSIRRLISPTVRINLNKLRIYHCVSGWR